MNDIQPKDFSDNAISIAQKIMHIYWGPLYKYVKENNNLIKNFTGFLLNHEKIIFYFGKTHLAIEYIGPERIDEVKSEGQIQFGIFDYTLTKGNFFENIIGFSYDSTSGIGFPLPEFAEELIIPTNKGMDKLAELNWNFAAQDSILAFNVGNFFVPEGHFTRIVNSLFFDANQAGLKTRHVKWIDFIPLQYNDSHDDYDSMSIDLNPFSQLVKHDAHYIYPMPKKDDYKFSKLPQINRFIEIAGNTQNSETDITSFLERDENKFILSMAFLAKEVHPQLICEWQNENRNSLKPDFFIVHPNGYANIVEFKLPHLKNNSITGIQNRESFSAEINSYISQTRKYKTYFENPNNRQWFENKYNFKVHYPKRTLVIGRRWNFSNEEWREIISDYRDIEIITYDDLVDGVVAQFYL